jgi:GNAT superfamily N-acetyltransferase
MRPVFKRLPEEAVEAAARLEAQSYPPDEAASLAKLTFRQKLAGDYFWAAFDHENSQLLGFVCGTISRSDRLEHETMSEHHADGVTLCIHSVVVVGSHRRQGLASTMLCEYVRQVALNPRLERIRLISKPALLRFYTSCGFVVEGLSAVVHGSDPWFDLVLDLDVRARSFEWAQIDAFVDLHPRSHFSGNPAAVVLLRDKGDADPEWMQAVALENNLSETAFLIPIDEPSGRFGLRWFTPTTEVLVASGLFALA